MMFTGTFPHTRASPVTCFASSIICAMLEYGQVLDDGAQQLYNILLQRHHYLYWCGLVS